MSSDAAARGMWYNVAVSAVGTTKPRFGRSETVMHYLPKQLVLVAVIGLVWAGATGIALGQTSGLSSFGSRTLGGSTGGGQTGTAANQFDQNQQNAAQITGNERFVRDARDAGQFVGADSGDTENFFSQQNNVNARGLNLTAGRDTNNRGNNNVSQQRIFRRRLHVNFAYTPRLTTGIHEALTERIARVTVSSINLPATVQATMEDTTVVLQGTVATEEQKLLSERLARLESGVWAVRNELLVVAEPSDPSSSEIP